MSQIKTGGPAFPSTVDIIENGDLTSLEFRGMTLRDWFAGQALTGLLAANTGGAVDLAFKYADEMIARLGARS